MDRRVRFCGRAHDSSSLKAFLPEWSGGGSERGRSRLRLPPSRPRASSPSQSSQHKQLRGAVSAKATLRPKASLSLYHPRAARFQHLNMTFSAPVRSNIAGNTAARTPSRPSRRSGSSTSSTSELALSARRESPTSSTTTAERFL